MRVETVILGEGGVLAIPPAVCEEIGFEPGETIVIESDGDSLLLRTQASVIRESQATIEAYIPLGVSLADELIAERRAEAAAENETGGSVWTQPTK